MEEAPIDPLEGDLDVVLWAHELDADHDAEQLEDHDGERWVSEADWNAASAPSSLTAAEEAALTIASATARMWVSFADAIEQARATPWEWVPCPVGQASPTQRDFAERAVIADIAVRIRVPEATVATQAHLADTGRRRLPLLWAQFATGLVSAQHLRVALDAAPGLEGDALAEFDTRMSELAPDVSAARLRPRARLLAERLDPESLTERRREAETRRGAWVEPGRDGMAWLSAHLPAFTAARISARLNAAAAELATAADETRTRDQLRADVLADLLTGDGTEHPVTASVAVTVPVMTLLGVEDRPATLDGWIPIDAETARAAAVNAPSLIRILTDPISSTVLDVDRRSYRPPAALARFVRIRDVECTRAGCGRRAADCDLDHMLAWTDDGVTADRNLHAACPPHHRQKHQTRWAVARAPDGRITWTSPTGYLSAADPPPF